MGKNTANSSSSSSASSSTSSNHRLPCAACIKKRRKCPPDCIFAPLFPKDRIEDLLKLKNHYGGLKKVAERLQSVAPSIRQTAVNTMLCEANARVIDPTHGIVQEVRQLENEIERAELDRDITEFELALRRNPNLTPNMNQNSIPNFGRGVGVYHNNGMPIQNMNTVSFTNNMNNPQQVPNLNRNFVHSPGFSVTGGGFGAHYDNRTPMIHNVNPNPMFRVNDGGFGGYYNDSIPIVQNMNPNPPTQNMYFVNNPQLDPNLNQNSVPRSGFSVSGGGFGARYDNRTAMIQSVNPNPGLCVNSGGFGGYYNNSMPRVQNMNPNPPAQNMNFVNNPQLAPNWYQNPGFSVNGMPINQNVNTGPFTNSRNNINNPRPVPNLHQNVVPSPGVSVYGGGFGARYDNSDLSRLRSPNQNVNADWLTQYQNFSNNGGGFGVDYGIGVSSRPIPSIDTDQFLNSPSTAYAQGSDGQFQEKEGDEKQKWKGKSKIKEN